MILHFIYAVVIIHYSLFKHGHENEISLQNALKHKLKFVFSSFFFKDCTWQIIAEVKKSLKSELEKS